ncbi:MAG TPA: hypothetical protein VLF62_00360 [Candidatus Saccharimonadales bacterium]|nr:hypothetical protein [Candidatus Saccharimonadales bacterium]
MDRNKKMIVGGSWIIAGLILCAVFVSLRHIGTDWINEPGFARTMLLGLLALSIPACIVLAVLALLGRPNRWYTRLK